MTSDRLYKLVVAGRYAEAGVLPPVSGPSVYARIAREVIASHDIDPLGDASELAEAEGLIVAYAPTPGRCAIHSERLIVMPWVADVRERSFRITHERAHAHLRTRGAPMATECDALHLTLALAAPAWCTLAQLAAAEFLPVWALELRYPAPRVAHR